MDLEDRAFARPRECGRFLPTPQQIRSTRPDAGDTYLAGYVTARLKGLSPYQSAHIGAIAASHKLEYAGPLQASFDELSQHRSALEAKAIDPVTVGLH